MPAKKEGYSGVALLSKLKPLKVDLGFQVSKGEEHDDEGRLITAEFEHFFLATAYVPNAGKKLVTLPKRLEWDKLLRDHLTKLDKTKVHTYIFLCQNIN